VRLTALQSDLLRYIVENGYRPGDLLPTIQSISRNMDVSIAKTRESLEVARALGAVEIKPGRGTRVAEYTFAPAASMSALYAIGLDSAGFEHLSELRNALEGYFWEAAVTQLAAVDIAGLRAILESAHERLSSQPVQVPAEEHRRLHLALFARLDNPFVLGILEAFWEAYDTFGFNVYTDLDYHRRVWDYHERIVAALEVGDIDGGRHLLVEHMHLLGHRRAIPGGYRLSTDPRLAGFE
jgi:DNA-binding FadR family transcriptional regulator